MLIAATRWIHFYQLCPGFTSRQKIWTCQVREWVSRKMCHLHVLEFPMPNRLLTPLGGYAYQRGIGSGGYIPLS